MKIVLLMMVSVMIGWSAGNDIVPIPVEIEYDRQKAHVGKKLFFDPRLSKDGTVACVNCHILPGSGADAAEVSTGVGGAQGVFNSPTVLNAVLNVSQFWDGRAANLEEQVHGPVSNPFEMGISMEKAAQIVNADKVYRRLFKETYGAPATASSIANAIAEFQKALITPNSRFDRFLRGVDTAITKKEKKGYELFLKRGCVTCHNGVNLGGNMYQKSGIFFQEETVVHKEHYGRFNVTKHEKDKYYFKVPTLRNIALTAPYMHDGDVKDLAGAVRFMYRHQMGIHADEEEVDAMVSFLKTLTGEQPKILRKRP